jgi:hypothetical protein
MTLAPILSPLPAITISDMISTRGEDMDQNKSNATKDTLAKRPVPPAVDCDRPVPPVPPCTPEEYDEWYRAKVQEALDDPGEATYTHEEVMAATQAIIDQKRMEKELRERAKS